MKTLLLLSVLAAVSRPYAPGIASYYHSKFEGRKTASGAPYRGDALTAAHRTCKLGTRLRVTSTRTGRSVIVTVNDRGPFAPGRVLDLSRAAFAAIDDPARGLTPVRYEVVS